MTMEWISSVKDFLVKPHVFFLVVVMGLCVFAYAFSSKQRDDMLELIARQRQIQDESTKKIVDAYEEERLHHEENLKRLEATLIDVQRKYDEQVKLLEQRKEKQVDKLVKQYDEDPVEMTKQVGTLLGLVVVIPEAK